MDNSQKFFTHYCARRKGIPFLFTVALPFAFFGTIFWNGEQFAFRDIAHFYHPLDAYVDSVRAAGGSVDWMPYENFGQPLAACATVAAWYPVKWMRLLIADKALADVLYILFHLLIATATFYRLARHFGTSPAAAVFGAIAYAYGGNVLYQYANPPFLVGAAWFPEAFLRLHRLMRRDSRPPRSPAGFSLQPGFKQAIFLGIVLAFMILGGDAQAAYHVGLLAIILLLYDFICNACFYRTLSRTGFAFRLSRATCIGILIGVAFFLAAAIAAIQIIPSIAFARLSERTLLPEVQQYIIYDFSVPPFRLIEYVFPNIGGRMFPVNTRWLTAWDVERVWVPTLYMGFVPFLLAVASMRLFHRNPRRFGDAPHIRYDIDVASMRLSRRRSATGFLSHKNSDTVFLTWFAIAALLFALGRYAPFYEQLTRLPGYVSFRYPAKWLTVAAVPLSLLAAKGFDSLFHNERFRNCVLVAAGLAMFSFVVANWDMISLPVDKAPACPIFGPCDPGFAKTDFRCALYQTAFQAFVFCIAVGFYALRKEPQYNPDKLKEYLLPVFNRRTVPLILIALLCIDLYTANRWTIATCERAAFRDDSPLRDAIFRRIAEESDEPVLSEREKEPVPPVVYRCPWLNHPSFVHTSSPERLAESVRWDIATFYSKYPLLAPPAQRILSADVRGTMMDAAYFTKTNWIRHDYLEHSPDFEEQLAELGIRWVVAPAFRPLDPEKATPCPVDDAPEGVTLWKIAMPPAVAAQRSTAMQDEARTTFREMPYYQHCGTLASCATLGILLGLGLRRVLKKKPRA